VGGGRRLPLLRRRLQFASQQWWPSIVPIRVVQLDIEVDDRAMRNPCFLWTTATPAGDVSLLGGIIRALMVFLTSSTEGNLGLTGDRAMAAPRCRSLLEGIALVAHGVPVTADGVGVDSCLEHEPPGTP
jgi:hypothetical protein